MHSEFYLGRKFTVVSLPQIVDCALCVSQVAEDTVTGVVLQQCEESLQEIRQCQSAKDSLQEAPAGAFNAHRAHWWITLTLSLDYSGLDGFFWELLGCGKVLSILSWFILGVLNLHLHNLFSACFVCICASATFAPPSPSHLWFQRLNIPKQTRGKRLD